jgi:hypothetical protein
MKKVLFIVLCSGLMAGNFMPGGPVPETTASRKKAQIEAATKARRIEESKDNLAVAAKKAKEEARWFAGSRERFAKGFVGAKTKAGEVKDLIWGPKRKEREFGPEEASWSDVDKEEGLPFWGGIKDRYGRRKHQRAKHKEIVAKMAAKRKTREETPWVQTRSEAHSAKMAEMRKKREAAIPGFLARHKGKIFGTVTIAGLATAAAVLYYTNPDAYKKIVDSIPPANMKQFMDFLKARMKR